MPLKSFLGQKTVANKLFAELYQILSFSSFKVPGYLSFENTGLDLFFFFLSYTKLFYSTQNIELGEQILHVLIVFSQ